MNVRFHISSAHLLVAITLFVVGLLAVMQLRTQIRTVSAVQTRSTTDQALIMSKLIESNAVLRQTVDKLEAQIARYQTTSEEERLEAMVSDLNRLKIVDGAAEVVGEGVEISIKGKLGASALQDIINELRNSGAEAIALNRQRIVARSIVAGDESSLILDGARLRPPYLLEVVGPAQTMERALERKGGLLQLLRYNDPTLLIQVEMKQQVVIPIYDKETIFTYAKPVK